MKTRTAREVTRSGEPTPIKPPIIRVAPSPMRPTAYERVPRLVEARATVGTA